MNILIFSYKFYPDYGGIETHSEMLATYFSKRGNNVKVLTTSHSPQIDNAKNFGFEVIYQPTKKNIWKAVKWADVVLENNPSLSMSWPMLFSSKKHFITLHTWIRRNNGSITYLDRLKKLWLKKASNVIACSNALRSVT